jgi:hypothetical protein
MYRFADDIRRVDNPTAGLLRLTAKQHRLNVGENLQLYHWIEFELECRVRSMDYEVQQLGFWHRRLGLNNSTRLAERWRG